MFEKNEEEWLQVKNRFFFSFKINCVYISQLSFDNEIIDTHQLLKFPIRSDS